MVRVRNHPVLSSIWFFFICSVVIGLVGLFFFWKRDWGWYGEGYVVDNAVWGNLGDFIGGLFGPMLTTITVLFMWWTITEQQVLTKKTNRLQSKIQKRQEDMAEIQRFNDLFFSLLDLYHTKVKDLKITIPSTYDIVTANPEFIFSQGTYGGQTFSGKEFFSAQMEKLWADFSPKGSFVRSRRFATNDFTRIYSCFGVQLSVYFRTVYRIFRLIDESGIPDTEKKKYVKIMRTQLTRGEIFFIHYNARTEIGAPSRSPIVRYRITKHLQVFDFLEFKEISDKFTGDNQVRWEKREGLNLTLHLISEKMKQILKGKQILDTENRYWFKQSTRYEFYIRLISGYELELGFLDYENRHNLVPELKGLSDLNDDNRKWLLETYLRLIFIESSFGIINPEQYMDIQSELTLETGFKKITAKISNTNGNLLRITYPYRQLKS